MPPPTPPQPTRFAIQKARGKGWKTLEVGEDLDHARARFHLMVRVNPRAYFRLIQLDHNAGANYEGLEFNWKLIELHDPTQATGTKGRIRPVQKRTATARRAGEKVRLPVRFYVAVTVIGALVGVLLYLRFGLPAR